MDADIFAEKIPGPLAGSCFLSGFVAWRLVAGSGWVEVGLRAFDLFKVPFRDFPGKSYGGGSGEFVLGGALITRRILLFLRGAI